MMRSFPITLALLALILILSPATGRTEDRGGAAPTSPCDDARYQELLARSVTQMTDDEYAYFSRMKQECNESRSQPAADVAPSPLMAGLAPSPSIPLSPSSPSRASRIGFAVEAGFAPPTGPMTDIHNIGRSFGAGLSYQIDDQLALEVISLGFEHFALDKKEVPDSSLPGGSLSMLSILTGIRARLTAGNYSPFVALGVGIFRASYWDLRLPDGEVIDGKSRTALGLSVGGGIEGRVSEHSSAFTEIRASFAPAGDETRVYVPVRGGLRFDLR